jgi:hypothetical protein
MRAVSPAVAGILVLVPAVAFAQPAIPPIPPPMPEPLAPLVPSAPAPEPAVLPGGTDVSQPLQPIVIPPDTANPEPAGKATTVDEACPKPKEVLGHWWDSDELLIWWPKAHPLPPLVTATRIGTPPVFGRPDTLTLIGTRAIDNQDVAGYRLNMGFSLNNEDTVGIEGRYFFLGTRTLSAFATDLGNPRYQAIGLPFVNALNGQEDVLTVARAGVSSDLVTVFTTTRVQGAEANAVANLYDTKGAKLHAIVGYRFFQVQEGLRVEQTWQQDATPDTFGHTTLGAIADQFSTANRFHGGQLGLHADLSRGPFYVEVVGKVALGRNFEVVKIDGESHLLTFGANPLPLVRSFPGGVYAQLTNMGRFTNSAFAVVPEGTFKVGLKADRSRFFVGYNFLYLSDAVRPGDQVDRTINPVQIPMLNPGARFAGPDRPRPDVTRTDFWVQGLIVGFEGRY